MPYLYKSKAANKASLPAPPQAQQPPLATAGPCRPRGRAPSYSRQSKDAAELFRRFTAAAVSPRLLLPAAAAVAPYRPFVRAPSSRSRGNAGPSSRQLRYAIDCPREFAAAAAACPRLRLPAAADTAPSQPTRPATSSHPGGHATAFSSSSRSVEVAACHRPSVAATTAGHGDDEARAVHYFGNNLDEVDLVEEAELTRKQAQGVLKKVLDDFAGPEENPRGLVGASYTGDAVEALRKGHGIADLQTPAWLTTPDLDVKALSDRGRLSLSPLARQVLEDMAEDFTRLATRAYWSPFLEKGLCLARAADSVKDANGVDSLISAKPAGDYLVVGCQGDRVVTLYVGQSNEVMRRYLEHKTV